MSKYAIDFGAVDDNRNFEWWNIRATLTDDIDPTIELSDLRYNTRAKAEQAIDSISDYIQESIVSVKEVKN